MYIPVTPSGNADKSSLSKGVYGAVLFYAVTFFFSYRSYKRSQQAAQVFELSERIHDDELLYGSNNSTSFQ